MLRSNMIFLTFLTPLVSLSTLIIAASGATVQKPSLTLPADAAQNRQTVKDMFLYSYDAYKFVLPSGAAVAGILTTNPGSTHGAMMTFPQSVVVSPTNAMGGVRPLLTLFPRW